MNPSNFSAVFLCVLFAALPPLLLPKRRWLAFRVCTLPTLVHLFGVLIVP